MNQDVFAGQWRELRGTVKSWWGNLSDDDLDWIAGQKDRLVGLIQQKYGWSREQAQQDVERRFDEFPDTTRRSLNDLKAKTYEFGEQAADKARDALSAASEGWESARSYVRENDFSAMASDLREIVRKYPFYSLLIGAGIIYLLSRGARR